MPLFEVISGLFHHTSKYNPRYLNSGAGTSSGNVVINVEATDMEKELAQGISPSVLQKHYQKAMAKYNRKQQAQQETEEEEETEQQQQQPARARKPEMPNIFPGVDLNDKEQRHIVKKRISRQVQKILERSGADIENLDMNGLLQKLNEEMSTKGERAGKSEPEPKPQPPQEPDISQLIKHFENLRAPQPQPEPQPEPQPQPQPEPQQEAPSQEDLLQNLLAALQAQQSQPSPPPPTLPSPPEFDPEVLARIAQQVMPSRAPPAPQPQPQPQQPQLDPGVLQLLQQLLPGGLNLASLLGETPSAPSTPSPAPPTPRPPREPYRGHLDNKNQFVSHGASGGIDTGVATNGGKL